MGPGTAGANCAEDPRGSCVRDVLVIMQFEFQQSKVLELMVPEIQFILRVCELPVVQQRGARSANCAENAEIPRSRCSS